MIVAVGLSDRRLALALGARSRARSARPASIGRLFLTDHLIAFEVTSIVLLVAAVGGVVLGSHARAIEAEKTRLHGLVEEGSLEPEGSRVHGPGITWYVILAGMLFVTGARRRARAAEPADHPALGRDHAERLEPRADRVRAPLRARGRPGVRDRRDGVAASEVVVGLGLIVAMGRRNLELDVDKLRTLRG